MNPSIIPAPWKNFLSTIQTLHPSAIIAGGALRDTICDNQVKDVDIFIQDHGQAINDLSIAELFGIECVAKSTASSRDRIVLMHDIKQLKTIAAKNYTAKVDSRYVTQEGSGHQALVESFINYIYDVYYNGVNYQLIFVECDPVEMVHKDFDFGICKVYFDGTTLTVTDEFWYDYENKQLTIAGSLSSSQMIHTMYVHRPNMVKKFPNWKVVIDDLRKRELKDMPPSYQKMVNTPKDEWTRFAKRTPRIIEEDGWSEEAKAVPVTVTVDIDDATDKTAYEMTDTEHAKISKMFRDYIRSRQGDAFWSIEDMKQDLADELQYALEDSRIFDDQEQ